MQVQRSDTPPFVVGKPAPGEGVIGKPAETLDSPGDRRLLMIERIITHVEIDWWREPGGYIVQVKQKYCESTFNSGTMKEGIERYEQLTLDEARDVIDMVSEECAPGMEYAVQASLFVLE